MCFKNLEKWRITIRPYQDSDKQQIIDLITYIQQIEFQVPVTLEDQPDLPSPTARILNRSLAILSEIFTES